MIEKRYIEEILTAKLAVSHLFVTDIMVKSGNKIMVFIDGDQYVSVDDCKAVSRMIESGLNRDVEDFELQVSSHGADKWMDMPRQFPKFIGKKLDVILKSGEILSGKLMDADLTGIVIQPDSPKRNKSLAPGPAIISFDNLDKAKCIISFK